MNSKNGILAANFNGIESPCIYLRVAIRDRMVDGLFDTGSPILLQFLLTYAEITSLAPMKEVSVHAQAIILI